MCINQVRVAPFLYIAIVYDRHLGVNKRGGTTLHQHYHCNCTTVVHDAYIHTTRIRDLSTDGLTATVKPSLERLFVSLPALLFSFWKHFVCWLKIYSFIDTIAIISMFALTFVLIQRRGPSSTGRSNPTVPFPKVNHPSSSTTLGINQTQPWNISTFRQVHVWR